MIQTPHQARLTVQVFQWYVITGLQDEAFSGELYSSGVDYKLVKASGKTKHTKAYFST